MSDKTTFSSADVLATAGSTRVKPTFVQLAGLWLAAGVGAVIALVTVAVLVFVYVHYPAIPVLDHPGEESKATIEQYKELSQISIKSGQDLFQTIVTQALLPVLTAILGYIFGRSGKAE